MSNVRDAYTLRSQPAGTAVTVVGRTAIWWKLATTPGGSWQFMDATGYGSQVSESDMIDALRMLTGKWGFS